MLIIQAVERLGSITADTHDAKSAFVFKTNPSLFKQAIAKAGELRQRYSNAKCPDTSHPDSTLDVVAEGKKIHFEGHFCCAIFANSISIPPDYEPQPLN